jgi:HTH-type transcriptional regulator/antitoxin HipB
MRQTITTTHQVGAILRARRKARRLSQHDIAARLGISQSRLSILESDASAMTLDRLIALAKLLGFAVVLEDDSASDAPEVEW